MAGKSRGQGRKKRARTEVVPAAPPPASGAAAEEEVRHHAARSMMMATPLGALMRIEATIWMNSRGGRIMSVNEFYALARSHEWLGLCNRKPNSNGGTDEAKIMAPTMVPKRAATLSNDTYKLISQLSEEERLLFDILAVSAWDLKDFPKLFPLYRLQSSTKGKIQLEVLQQSQPKLTKSAAATTSKANAKKATRSEILGNRYHHSRKLFSFTSTAAKAIALQNWWEHAKNVAQMILDHRESIQTPANKGDDDAEKTSFQSIVTNNAKSPEVTIPTKQNSGKETTLEERVRARSQRAAAIMKAKKPSKMAGGSLDENDNKSLLELADALRSYSQRRISSSSGGGGSALDRLRNRGSSAGTGAHATKNVARLGVTDLLKDARISWKPIINESLDNLDSSGGNKSGRGGGTTRMVNIDLSRVLFQLRLKMVSDADVAGNRQMESRLLGLLEKLAALVPKWIHLRKAPSTLAGTTMMTEKKTGKVKVDTGTSNQTNATTSSHKLNIRKSIIVIRNDCVDYSADVRAKLGGRVHNPVATPVKKNGGNKRSHQEIEDQQPHKNAQGPVGVADAIVPPSFRRMYGNALGLGKGPQK